jgi:putative inorganic carbon (HCO3(-)) transporter
MPDLLEMRFTGPSDTTRSHLVFLALAASVAGSLVSIAASEILLAFALAGAVVFLKPRSSFFRPLRPLLLILLLFFFWTILAALASDDIPLGLTIAKKFFIFLLFLLVPLVARGGERITWIYRAVFAAAVVSSLAGLLQFINNPGRDLLHRISGFMSQWMTYSGLLMLTLVALAAYCVCVGWRRQWWVFPAGTVMFAAILLSQTRSAMLGMIAGLFVVLLLSRPRAAILLLALVPVAFLLSPPLIRQRFSSGWHAADPNTRNRIELMETSFRLIRDNPWFGVGPKNVSREAPRYRGSSEYPDWMYQHMHNNALQLAAERGIPGLLLWLWFMIRLAWDAWRLFVRFRRRPESREALMAATAALGGWTALMISGVFEYNFGDSEILILFLFIAAAPYAFPEGAGGAALAAGEVAAPGGA